MATDATAGAAVPAQASGAHRHVSLTKVAMVAGEASADLLGGLLLKGLRERHPGLTAQGIGGRALLAQGFEAWWPGERLAVRGYVEVLRHYREIVGIRHALAERLLADPPDVFIGVDAPDFNLDLARRLRQAGIATVQYVAPAVWAWRPERVEAIRRSVDHVLCLFPFEPELLRASGIAATYVGHPLAEVIPRAPDRDGARRMLALDTGRPVLALLPGSRRSEMDHLLARFIAAAGLLRQRHPGLQVVLPAVPALQAEIERQVKASGAAGWLQVVAGQSHTVLAACDLTLVASGTATLEAALFQRPMVIAYHMNPLSWWITRRKKLQPWVGLPNILCGEFVVPELLQGQATPERLAAAAQPWLDDPALGIPVQRRLGSLHDALRRDSVALAAEVVEALCERG